jgi:hypothetical protein
MKAGLCRRALGLTGILAASLLLAGCSSLLTEGSAAGAGVAAAGISSAVTKNGAVTAGIGIGAQAVTLAGVQYVERRVQYEEQEGIASAAGPLPVGGVAAWSVSHDIPIAADQHGEVAVSRVIVADTNGADTNGLDCKEIVFSVDHVEKKAMRRDFYTASICRDGTVWKWATAEPAVARWGSLQ